MSYDQFSIGSCLQLVMRPAKRRMMGVGSSQLSSHFDGMALKTALNESNQSLIKSMLAATNLDLSGKRFLLFEVKFDDQSRTDIQHYLSNAFEKFPSSEVVEFVSFIELLHMPFLVDVNEPRLC